MHPSIISLLSAIDPQWSHVRPITLRLHQIVSDGLTPTEICQLNGDQEKESRDFISGLAFLSSDFRMLEIGGP